MKKFIIISLVNIFFFINAYSSTPDMASVYSFLSDKRYAEANQELYNIFFSERCYLPEYPDYGCYYLMKAFIFEMMNDHDAAKSSIIQAMNVMKSCD